MNKIKVKEKVLDDFKPQYSCRFHPTNWWHEVGCSHKRWTKKQLQEALDNSKQSNAYMAHLLAGGGLNETDS